MMDLFSNFEPFECMLCLTYYSIRDAITKINFLSVHFSSGSGGGLEAWGPPAPVKTSQKKRWLPHCATSFASHQAPLWTNFWIYYCKGSGGSRISHWGGALSHWGGTPTSDVGTFQQNMQK